MGVGAVSLVVQAVLAAALVARVAMGAMALTAVVRAARNMSRTTPASNCGHNQCLHKPPHHPQC